jgi:hypothetical protein
MKASSLSLIEAPFMRAIIIPTTTNLALPLVF